MKRRKYPLWDVSPARLYPPGRLYRKLPDFLFRWNQVRITWMHVVDVFEQESLRTTFYPYPKKKRTKGGRLVRTKLSTLFNISDKQLEKEMRKAARGALRTFAPGPPFDDCRADGKRWEGGRGWV